MRSVFYWIVFILCLRKSDTTRCPTCIGMNCKEEVFTKCNRNNSQFSNKIGRQYIENSRKFNNIFGCIDLEYSVGGDLQKVKQCVSINLHQDICTEIQEEIFTVTKCEIRPKLVLKPGLDPSISSSTSDGSSTDVTISTISTPKPNPPDGAARGSASLTLLLFSVQIMMAFQKLYF